MAKRPWRELTPIGAIMERSSKRGYFYFLSYRARMAATWQQTVGPDVAANTFINAFEMGRLEVSVKAPAYLERYQYFVEDWKKR
ncbi:MAG: DciA family protein, partial [Deltaproteobacteria bacterium]|nr:DciA family protein [Deltaproteobacteria bacterium]